MQVLTFTRRSVLATLVASVPFALDAAATITRKDGSSVSPNLVRAVQRALTERGYNAGTDDGIMGPRTRDAIYAFQTDQGVEPTGQIDEALLVALGLAPAPEADAPAPPEEEPAEGSDG